MNKSLKILSLIVVVLVIAVPLVMRWKNDWKPVSSKDFAISEPEKLTKIYMVNRVNQQLMLEKQSDGGWTVNGRFRASEQKVRLFMETLRDIRAKNPVSEREHNAVVKNLSAEGIKVEFYEGEKKVKTYYVGGNTLDETGTYMFIDDNNSSVPYVVHIPGFVGYVSGRYDLNENSWRDAKIFNTDFNKFSKASVTYPGNEKNNFMIERTGEKFVLRDLKGEEIPGADQEKLKLYSALFNNVSYEGIINSASQGFVDSVKNAVPRCVITVTNKDNSSVQLKVYFKPVTSETKKIYDEKGNLLVFDVDRYYAVVNNNKELLMVQDYIFRNIFQTPAFFTTP